MDLAVQLDMAHGVPGHEDGHGLNGRENQDLKIKVV